MLAGVLFAPMPWLMRFLAGVLLGGIQVRHGERYPARGAVLMVSNHPATWIDVLVLHVALRRRLHFLARETLFRPRVRAWLLRLYGALPVAQYDDAPGRAARNEHTFERCRHLLEHGEVVAVFPEGVSDVDRSLRSFRTGAARIALASLRGPRPTRVIPVGIHYADRTRFRTRVVVSVGHALRLPAHEGLDERGVDTWIGTVTARLRGAVEGLILELPETPFRRIVEELAPLVPREAASDAAGFERARRLARWMTVLQRSSPSQFDEIARHARRHRRVREALRLELIDESRRSHAQNAGLAIAWIAGAAPALAGLLLNAVPAFVTEQVAKRFDATRVALIRIGAGGVSFGLWYATLAVASAVFARSLWIALAAPLVALSLGACTLVWIDGWREVHVRMRWFWLAWRRPRLLARLGRERAVLSRLLERAPGVQRTIRARAVVR